MDFRKCFWANARRVHTFATSHQTFKQNMTMGRKSLAALTRISNLQKVSEEPPQKKQKREQRVLITGKENSKSVAYTKTHGMKVY
jgi:hypothetical protein